MENSRKNKMVTRPNDFNGDQGITDGGKNLVE